MDDTRSRDTGRLALAVGLVAAGSVISLATYFAIGGPFGRINDVGNAATGVLSACLAWRLRDQVSGTTGRLAVGAALVGAAITVVGSALVLSGRTGFLYAGLVSCVGFAGIGLWLVVLGRSRGVAGSWPPRLRATGVAAGALMVIGIVTAPGIPLGLDDMKTTPAWVWIGFVSWAGTYVAYPIWAIWMGRVEMHLASRVATARGAISVAD